MIGRYLRIWTEDGVEVQRMYVLHANGTATDLRKARVYRLSRWDRMPGRWVFMGADRGRAMENYGGGKAL